MFFMSKFMFANTSVTFKSKPKLVLNQNDRTEMRKDRLNKNDILCFDIYLFLFCFITYYNYLSIQLFIHLLIFYSYLINLFIYFIFLIIFLLGLYNLQASLGKSSSAKRLLMLDKLIYSCSNFEQATLSGVPSFEDIREQVRYNLQKYLLLSVITQNLRCIVEF